jgi:hypothetical protein
MKIQLNPVKKLRASAMIAVSIFAVLVSATLAAYLIMVQNEYTQVSRSQTWNGSMTLAEAGLEEGMAAINMNVTNFGVGFSFNLITNWTANAVANGWTDLNGDQSVWTMTRTNVDGKGGYYSVWITNAMAIGGGTSVNITNPIVVSVGVSTWSLNVASAARPVFAQTTLIGNSRSQVTREVYVQTYYNPLFSGAMTTLTNIAFGNGNGGVVDSFDSADPAHSDWNTNFNYGTYDSALRKDNGNVSSDSTVNVAVSTGNNTDIYGHINTGPGGGVNVGNNASVGSLNYINGGSSGIEGGYSSDDMNITFTDVTLPPAFPLSATAPTTISASGNVQFSGTLNNNLTIQGPGDPPAPITVTLYLPNGINYSGQKQLTVGTNATVIIYLGGNVSSGGNSGINNLTQNAKNLSIWALPNVTSIGFQGNAAFTGTIYAPEAMVTFGGSGNGNYDVVGSIDSMGVTYNGHPSFHYDENLARVGPGRGFVPNVWREVVVH